MKSVMRALFVAEKNDAAKGIAAILSRGSSTRRDSRSRWNKVYQFRAPVLNDPNCFVAMTSVSGHLLQHQFPPTHKSWNDTPMGTLFEVPLQKGVIPGMEDIRDSLIEECRQCDLLVIWTDCDREGEDIGAEIASVCGGVRRGLDIYRARFSEITQAAVWRALNNLVRLDQRLVDAVECRSELDLRIGAAFTRLQTLHLRSNFANIFRDNKDIISYGSCQFPTLGFVVERYKAIEEFVAEPFWKLVATHKKDDINVEFLWDRQRLFDQRVVQIFLDECLEARLGRISKVTRKPKSKWRPSALDTVELEKLAVRKLHISAKDAMAVAERLYNKGYISYPRTETNKFPSNLDLTPYVEQQTANAEWGDFAQEVLNRGPNPRNGTKSDEAHPPIHPLKFASMNDLVGLEWAIYELVVRHFLACLSMDARGQETKVQLMMSEEGFTATGLFVEDLGYLKVYKYEKWGDKVLPEYKEGEIINCHVAMAEGKTQPPLLLNEADLIALMDKYGIGTDATHADHIEKIKERQYAALNADNRFVPGFLGLALVDGYDRMGYAMSKPHMRADLESNLKLICLGQKNKDEVLREQIARYRRIFEQTEVKITFLSNAFREYLNKQNRQPGNGTGGPFSARYGGLGGGGNGNGRPPPPAPPGNGVSKDSTRGRGRTSRGGRSSSRGRGAAQQPVQATANMSDIDLLEGLSILNTGRPTKRTKPRDTGATRGNAATGRGGKTQSKRASGGKLCGCGEPAIRLQVRKEGPNHGRFFWTCRKDRSDPAKCTFFEWEPSANT